MKELRPNIKWKFDFEEEIPDLNIVVPFEKKKEEKETKIVIHKKIKNGRDSSSNTGLF